MTQTSICCEVCKKAILTWEQWFCEPCGGDMATAHTLDWSLVKLLDRPLDWGKLDWGKEVTK